MDELIEQVRQMTRDMEELNKRLDRLDKSLEEAKNGRGE